ncbi:hypothetical protein DFP94_104235 [Fontibacillus phaseoli]|uniref:Exosporium-targeted protein n=1 Tax=Fontibacillus phaseoli TaxID=1416533 RepID=A0A369BDZ0_9BACL|nr:hypothetical protein [Fontibacillus phaseoli]RCX19780.1 hypothetical protein DFP94_104235 [Fontibacillus phaseoli]
MPNFLVDSQISQGSSFANSISVPASTTPALFGTLGLNTAGAGDNLRVHFSATVTLAATIAILVPVTITIVRVIGGVSTTVYTATESLPVGNLLLTTDVFTVSGIDVPPDANFIIYRAFVSIPGGLAVIPNRVGPESFQAVAYSDTPALD